ncbi:hypothetical protein FHR72_004278 [Mycolicibacterium iranicum]|uniref:Uncharacterized protein n=1 Tax=Mycolicibacterium iranicum TaxID=912594 RepID=A0A839QDA9_MYCIR|nr:hypothetical protein [Mycolicibacterium iranicum]
MSEQFDGDVDESPARGQVGPAAVHIPASPVDRVAATNSD